MEGRGVGAFPIAVFLRALGVKWPRAFVCYCMINNYSLKSR